MIFVLDYCCYKNILAECAILIMYLLCKENKDVL